MAKIQYVTNELQEKSAIILPIFDYEETFHSTIKTATLSSVNVAYDLLNLPKKVRSFVDSLIRLRGSDWDVEVILTDEKMSKAMRCSTKTLERNRAALREYVKSKEGKAIVDYEGKIDENHRNIGTIYKLNIVQSVYKAIKDYCEAKKIDLKEFCRVASQLDIFILEERENYNSSLRELIDCIENRLRKLPDEPKILPSEITKGAMKVY